MREIQLAILAQDYFLGRVHVNESREVGASLIREISERSHFASISLPGPGFLEFLDRILNILKNLAVQDPGQMARGLAIAVYYFLNLPSPSDCTPGAIDKWRHCYVGCKINFYGGSLANLSAEVLKEITDLFFKKNDVAEAFRDFVATLGGAWNCGFFESCENCCCKKGF